MLGCSKLAAFTRFIYLFKGPLRKYLSCLSPRRPPKIRRGRRDHQIEYIDAGTPITNTHYIAAPKGEIYGVDHGIARFSPELNATIRPQTPLKNLYLTGQDVFLCGFAGALAGALTCGSVILNRNLHLDAIALAKRTKYMNNKLKDE
uniref:Uncharacterized protein n=1 Tax=Poecilia mexicana TaxID=48701 RepID=A0A3B3XNB6_9TELE